jgi:hypothetical protein
MAERAAIDDLRAWSTDWIAGGEAVDPRPALRRHVARRDRLIRIWVGTDLAMGVSAFVLVGYRALTQPDWFDRASMALLAFLIAAVLVMALGNWRGSWRALGETTSSFLAVSARRCQAFRRAVRIGWVTLAAEAVIFVPWIWHESGGPLDRPRGPWLLLGALLFGETVLLAVADRWARREARIIDALGRERGGEDEDER